MALITASGLCRVYDVGSEKLQVLKDVSLSIDEGEFVALMGPSGSGKSTLMNQLGCLDRPTSGEITLNGQTLSQCSADQLAEVRCTYIGFVFQQFNLLPRLTALDNVALPLMYAGKDRKEARGRALECLSQVGLADRASHRPSELSGGQQQRVAIARAIVNQPRLILADEPTGALDTRTGHGIMELFKQLNQQGITLIIVTHEADIAAYARRQLLFRDGELVSDSSRHMPHEQSQNQQAQGQEAAA